jgi:hypothetical protein
MVQGTDDKPPDSGKASHWSRGDPTGVAVIAVSHAGARFLI